MSNLRSVRRGPNGTTVFVDDEPANEYATHKAQCKANPDRWHPTGCTRPAGHEGGHGHPNWSGRFEISKGYGYEPTIKVTTRHSHGGASARLRDREDLELLVSTLRAAADEIWGATATE